jgi:hypothetical protein
MAVIITGTKQPYDRKDWDVDTSPWLVAGDSVSSATQTVECVGAPSDSALVVDAPIVVTPFIKVWTEGGTSLKNYKITVRFVTSQGRKLEYEIVIKVKDE